MVNSNPFDQYTSRYDNWYNKHEKIFESEVRAIRSVYSFTGNGIEIGVGTGRFAQALGIENGLEPSRNMSELARKRGINVIEGNAENIPVKDHVYHYCLMVNTLCFLDDVDKAMSEIRRVTTKNGEIIIGYINKNSLLGKKYHDKKEDNIFYKNARFYSNKEIRNILLDNNFKIIQNVNTLFGDIENIQEVQPVKSGYGEGGFVVTKAQKI